MAKSQKKKKNFSYDIDNIETFSLLKEGLPYEAVEELIGADKLSIDEIKHFIPARTLARRKQSKRLNTEESDVVARLSMLFDLAEEIFGTREKAKVWLRRPNRALNGHKPIDLMVTNYGARMVEKILGRIAYGVYS